MQFDCNKKLPEPSKIRTGVNDIERLKDLHEAIKYTPNSYFKLLQVFITNIKQKGNSGTEEDFI